PVAVRAGDVAERRVCAYGEAARSIVPGQAGGAGNVLTVYSITRDAGGNFVANVAADAWSLVSKTGGVVDGDLVAAGDNKSAVFTGLRGGRAQIRATSGALAVTNTHTITVVAGTSTGLR